MKKHINSINDIEKSELVKMKYSKNGMMVSFTPNNTSKKKKKQKCKPLKKKKKRQEGTKRDSPCSVNRAIRHADIIFFLKLTKHTQVLAVTLTCNKHYQTKSPEKIMEYFNNFITKQLIPKYFSQYPKIDYICCKDLTKEGFYHLHVLLMYHSNDKTFYIPLGEMIQETPDHHIIKKTPERNTLLEMWHRGTVTVKQLPKEKAFDYLMPHQTKSKNNWAIHMNEKYERLLDLPLNTKIFTFSTITPIFDSATTVEGIFAGLETINKNVVFEKKWKTKNFNIGNKQHKKWFVNFIAELNLTPQQLALFKKTIEEYNQKNL